MAGSNYDKHINRQSFSRQVTKDPVEKEDRPTDPLAPVRVVNESGKVMETTEPPFKPKDPPSQSQEPVTLHDLLNRNAVESALAPEKPKSTAFRSSLDAEAYRSHLRIGRPITDHSSGPHNGQIEETVVQFLDGRKPTFLLFLDG
ncbi:hypothetical protein F5B20DRAFT_585615 [Whalleya microplaca]|nr:hypothetical protein F5B20DRAFT_585615 [Whalleya microplaca]